MVMMVRTSYTTQNTFVGDFKYLAIDVHIKVEITKSNTMQIQININKTICSKLECFQLYRSKHLAICEQMEVRIENNLTQQKGTCT